MSYVLAQAQGADHPTIFWQLVNTTTNTTVFSGFDDTATGLSESTGTLSGTIAGSGDYKLLISGNLGETTMPNSSASETVENFNFSVLVTSSTVASPEPSTAFLLSIVIIGWGTHRRRSES